MNDNIVFYDSLLSKDSSIDESFFKEKIESTNFKPYLSLMYSYYLVGKGEIEKSKKILDNVKNIDKEPFLESLFLMNEGLIASYQQDDKFAERKLKDALEADISNSNKWVRLELFRFLNEKVDYEAWGYLESALKIDPNFSQAKIEKSYQLDEDINCREVIELLFGLPNSYKDSDAQNLLGVALINCKEYDSAKAVLEKSIAYESTSNNNFSLAQLMHEYYNQIDVAEELYKKSLEIDPSNMDAINGYAWLLYDKDDFKKAETTLLGLLEFSEEQDIYNQIINFYFLTKRPEEAAKYIEKSMNIHGVNHISDGYQIILQIYRKESYEPVIEDFKKHYSQNEIEWLKNQIVFFFGEE